MRWAISFAIVIALAAGSSASLSAEEVDLMQLKRQWTGIIVALRRPLRGSELVFQPDGQPVPPIQNGTFGRDALFRVDEVRLDGRILQFQCHRVILMAKLNVHGLEFFPLPDKTLISVTLPSRAAEPLTRSTAAIFRSSAEVEALLMNYGRAFSREGVLEPDRPVFSCRLHPLARPAPYGSVGGRFVARVIVNEFGEPEGMAVLSAPKSKHDAKTFIETLWDWRFAPFQKNGKATACTATIGMRFGPRSR